MLRHNEAFELIVSAIIISGILLSGWACSMPPLQPTVQPSVQPQTQPPTQSTTAKAAFFVYIDADSPENHYKPSGYMGDCGDIFVDEAFGKNPHSGETCIQVIYQAKGKSPNECPYSPPCKWAGIYWQEPPNNWGKDSAWKGRGFDLSGYKRIMFWSRADKECMIEFKVGGISEAYGDSLLNPRSKRANLTLNWNEFEIDLTGANLNHIIGGFCWVTDWQRNPDGATFYIDDIRFEGK